MAACTPKYAIKLRYTLEAMVPVVWLAIGTMITYYEKMLIMDTMNRLPPTSSTGPMISMLTVCQGHSAISLPGVGLPVC